MMPDDDAGSLAQWLHQALSGGIPEWEWKVDLIPGYPHPSNHLLVRGDLGPAVNIASWVELDFLRQGGEAVMAAVVRHMRNRTERFQIIE